MKITYSARQMDVPTDLRELFDRKLPRLDKFFRDDADAFVKFSRKRGREIIELTINSAGTIFRAEKECATFQSAFDEAVDAIIRQIRKNKTRLEKRLRDDAFSSDTPADQYEEEPAYRVYEKTLTLLPMTVDEAILQMNLLGHPFYMFKNIDTDAVNVVYRRLDDAYGLISHT